MDRKPKERLFRFFVRFRSGLFWVSIGCFGLLIFGLVLELFGVVFPRWLIITVLSGVQLIWVAWLLHQLIDIPSYNEERV